MKTDNLPPSMQIIELTRAAGGNDLQFATAAGMKPVECVRVHGDSFIAGGDLFRAPDGSLHTATDRRAVKRLRRKFQVVR